MQTRLFRSRGRRPLWLAAGSSAWMATVANAPLWRELHSLNLLSRPAGWVLAISLALIIGASLTAVLSLLCWRYTFKPLIVVLLLASASGAYFMFSYHVVLDHTMLVNVLQTDPNEAAALLSPWLVASMLLLGVLPAWLVWRTPADHRPWPRQTMRNIGVAAISLVVVALAALASFEPLSSAMRNHKQLRYLMNPLNSLYALGYEAASPLRRDEHRLEPLGMDAKVASASSSRPPLLVLVVGETARSGNFSLNGYERPTTPELAREHPASFRHVQACGTSTAASLPCMFSHLGRDEFEARAYNYENLVDVLQHAGLAVLWLDNQGGCKGVCERVPHEHTQNDDPELCKDGECFDGALLRNLDERLARLPAERRQRGTVLVLHQMGSHGPAYWRRSPSAFKRFVPECTSNNLQDCSREELLNAYDNSIEYVDHVLASTIGWLKGHETDYDTAMVYVADHGESLGENNLYLHGLPYGIAPDVQKVVPWITWLSPGFERSSGVSLACVQGLSDAPLTHDNYFHSVLGLMQVKTSVYDARLDAYAACTH